MKDILINDWATFKAVCITKKQLLLQYTEDSRVYDIYAPDTNILLWNITLNKGSSEALDFEQNYKDSANQPLPYTETAGRSQFEPGIIELGEGDTEKSCEWIFQQDIYINKALPIPVDAQWGDYIDLEVWLADDSQMLVRYGNHIPVIGTKPDQWFEGTGAGKIPVGCKVKCVYHKAGTGTRKFALVVEFII
jgi:hypothetical protein